MPAIRTYIVSKLSRNGRPYCVKTLSDFPCEDTYQLHWYMKERICQYHGWGTYYVTRSQAYGESKGYKLIVKLRLAKEAIGIMRVGSSPVFPKEQWRKPYWENPDQDLRLVKVGLRRVHATPSLGTTLSKVQSGNVVPRMKGRGMARARPGDWSWKLNRLFKGTRPQARIFGAFNER